MTRRGWWGLGLVAAFLCIPGTTGAGAPSAAAPAPVVTITTANIRTGTPPAGVRHDLRRARSGSTTVVLTQELWHVDAARLAPPGWAVFQTARPVPGCRGTAVWWDRSVWRFLRGHAVVLARAGYRNGTRCASVVILRHRATGLRLPLLDVHMTSHVEVAGRARTCCPDRVAAYGRAMGRVTELGGQLRRRYGRAIIGGDWNVDWPADHRVQSRVFPYAHLWRTWDTHWAKLPATGPTHGSRRIDALWWTERSIRPVDSDTLRRTASDHNFVRLTVRLLGT